MKEFITHLMRILHEQHLAYAIGGSIASTLYSEPRFTQDIDLSIQLNEADIDPLITACEALEWYISSDEIERAMQTNGIFTINDGFWKADLFVIGGDKFATEAFARRQQGPLSLTGETAWFLRPEDVIIHKLRWCAGKPLDKHMRDITAILSAQYDRLDITRITEWAATFDAGQLWSSILKTYHEQEND
jgi:hypothetical protein